MSREARVNYSCDECNNEFRLSIQGDTSDVPEDCPVNAYDEVLPIWREDNR